MNGYRYIVVFLGLCIVNSFYGCDPPLLPENIKDDVIFNIDADIGSIVRIVKKATVDLSWSEIIITDFKEIRILRFNHHRDIESYQDNETRDGWLTVGSTTNEFITTWTDTVTDDAEFTYKVRYVDEDENYRETEISVILPLTTSLQFPDEVDSLHLATKSLLIDDGDTIFIDFGNHQVEPFSFHGKDIQMIGKYSPANTYLIYKPRIGESGDPISDSSFIALNKGCLQNVTVQSGIGEFGGGVKLTGVARLKRCIIAECTAVVNKAITSGVGGALYLSDQASVTNCIVKNDSTFLTHAGIYIDEMGGGVQITNSVIYNNHIVSRTPQALVQNCIFTGTEDYPYPHHPNFYEGGAPIVKYSSAGTAWFGVDSTNVVGNPLFINSPFDFHLQTNSPCVDRGNPQSNYNDFNGTRNDIGAFGGPKGNWYNNIVEELP